MLRTALCGLALLVAGTWSPARADDEAKPLAFELKDPAGKPWRLEDHRGKWVVLEWVNYDCPFVKKHYDASHRNMQTLQSTYTAKGVVWFSICSSGEGKKGYLTPEQATERLKSEGAAPTALLLDPEGDVGRLLGAKVTPDVRIIDPEGKVAYAGAIDSLRGKDPAEVKDATNYVATFLDAVLADQGRPFAFHPPYG
ncbi:MAG: redoxin domain-containing protein [Planctomycetota bacterium]